MNKKILLAMALGIAASVGGFHAAFAGEGDASCTAPTDLNKQGLTVNTDETTKLPTKEEKAGTITSPGTGTPDVKGDGDGTT